MLLLFAVWPGKIYESICEEDKGRISGLYNVSIKVVTLPSLCFKLRSVGRSGSKVDC